MTTAENVSTSLREHGLKVTPKRLAVAGLLLSRRGSMPEAVWQRLRPKLGALGLPTVYRILEDLERVGLLARIELEDRVLRYAACRAAPGIHHHHTVCIRCGCVGQIADCPFEREVGRLERRTGFRVLRHRLQVEGVCARCRREGKG
jgi:Fur family ferric uptake transcriptional regulator